MEIDIDMKKIISGFFFVEKTYFLFFSVPSKQFTSASIYI